MTAPSHTSECFLDEGGAPRAVGVFGNDFQNLIFVPNWLPPTSSLLTLRSFQSLPQSSLPQLVPIVNPAWVDFEGSTYFLRGQGSLL